MPERRFSDEAILAEIRRVATLAGGVLSRPNYAQHKPSISENTIRKRFGSWMAALDAAGVKSPSIPGGRWVTCPVCGVKCRPPYGKKGRKTCGNPACTHALLTRRGWKGDEATAQAARGRAASVVPAIRCSRCGSTSRLQHHHRDRNPYNNETANIEILCLPCHKTEHRGEPRRRKRSHGGRQSEAQREFQRQCEHAGVRYILATSVDDIRELL